MPPKKEWRNAKAPAPASVRLGRAQARLDTAIALQAEARRAPLNEQQAHRARMAHLGATMEDCTAKVDWRRQQLRAVQDEVGAGGSGAAHTTRQREAIQRVHHTLCGEVGPTIAALVEQLDTATPAWATLNGLLGKLSSSKELLEQACPAQPPAQAYDLTRNDGAGDQGDGHWEDDWSDWSESHEVQGGGGGGDEQGIGRDAYQGDGDGDDQPMGTGEWWDAPPRRWQAGSAKWEPQGHGKWARGRGSWADQLEAEHEGTDGAEEQPAATRRRLDDDGAARGSVDGGQQQRPHEQQQQQVPEGGPVGELDMERQKQLHAQRVERIINMAIDAGVNPVMDDGEEIRMLDPHQLDAWVAAKLPAALLC